jgi:hypothetical protein
MPKAGPKPKAIAKPRHNPYSYQLPGPFLGSSDAFLHTAHGQDPEDNPEDDLEDDSEDEAIDDVRRRS